MGEGRCGDWWEGEEGGWHWGVNDLLVMGKDKGEDTFTEKSQRNDKVGCKYLRLHVDIVWDFRGLITKTKNGLCVSMFTTIFSGC